MFNEITYSELNLRYVTKQKRGFSVFHDNYKNGPAYVLNGLKYYTKTVTIPY